MTESRAGHFVGKADWVTQELRQMILSGELTPGARLRQRELAERFGVSPTPVREALRRLQAESFVTGEIHRSATVVRIEAARLYENALIREALEALAAQLAARNMTDKRISTLRKLGARFAAAPHESAEATKLNREFHFAIYAAADAPMLYDLLENLWQTLRLGPQIFRPHEDSVEQHTAMVEALAAGEADLVAELTRVHVSESAKHMLASAGDDSRYEASMEPTARRYTRRFLDDGAPRDDDPTT